MVFFKKSTKWIFGNTPPFGNGNVIKQLGEFLVVASTSGVAMMRILL